MDAGRKVLFSRTRAKTFWQKKKGWEVKRRSVLSMFSGLGNVGN